MKKLLQITGGFLLVLFLFQSAGQYLLFSTLQHQARREAVRRIAGGLPAHQLTVLRLPPAEQTRLHYVEEHEIRYQDHLYDIVRSEHQGDTLVLYVLPDDRETALYQQWTRQFRQTLPQPGDMPTPLSLFQEISQLKYLVPAILFLGTNLDFSAPLPSYLSHQPESAGRQPPSPPPR